MIRSLLILIPFALVLAGCGDKDKTEGGMEADKHEAHGEHAHAGKHGGTLLELGAHEGFLEVLMDHDKGQAIVWAYLGEEMTDTKLGDMPVLNFKAGDKPMQLKGKLQADGSWVFMDESLKGEPEGARFRVVLAGKTYSPEWAHAHDHGDHDGDDEDMEDHDEEGHDHDAEEPEGEDEEGGEEEPG